MSSQLVNMNIGHGNKKVIQAIKDQADKMAFMGPGYAFEAKSEAARKIIEVAPDNMAKVFFTNAGAEANENAIKMARMYTGRNKVFSRYRSYHGATYGAANLTGEPGALPANPALPASSSSLTPTCTGPSSNSKTMQKPPATTSASCVNRSNTKART
jgi:taurine---2-oxoglutarate transaminase